jgi:hypothetical protein
MSIGSCTFGLVKNGVKTTPGKGSPEHGSYAPSGGPTGPDVWSVESLLLVTVESEPPADDELLPPELVLSEVPEAPEVDAVLVVPIELVEPEPPEPPVPEFVPEAPVDTEWSVVAAPPVDVVVALFPVAVEVGATDPEDVSLDPDVSAPPPFCSLLQATRGATTPPSATKTSDFLMDWLLRMQLVPALVEQAEPSCRHNSVAISCPKTPS